MRKYLPIVTTLFLIIVLGTITEGCSKNDHEPEDYVQSLLSGEYGKGKLWQLTTTLDGDTISPDGYVRLDLKYQSEEADLRFVDIIPGVSNKEFKGIPLISSEAGLSFVIDDNSQNHNIHITGKVSFGAMTVDIILSE